MHEQRAPTRPFRRPLPVVRLTATLVVLACCGVAGVHAQPLGTAPAAAAADDRPLQDRVRASDAQHVERVHLERELARRQDRIERLEAEARDVATERAALQRRVAGYTVVRAIAVVALGAALGLTVALLVALSRGRDEHRRRVLLVAATQTLREAVERDRRLGAQLELKYQNLYRQSAPAARAGGAASVLLADYQRERTPVEMAIRRSESEIDEVLDELQVA